MALAPEVMAPRFFIASFVIEHLAHSGPNLCGTFFGRTRTCAKSDDLHAPMHASASKCNRAIGTTEVPCIQMQKSAILATHDSMGAIDREFG